jgi:PTH1 family peptidyl-tRNA hydrolase
MAFSFLFPLRFPSLALQQVLDYFKLPLSSVLVVVDEVALEMGQIRLRQTGSAGGHNGLKSIEGHLKSKDYNRLRIGVGGGECGLAGSGEREEVEGRLSAKMPGF